MTKRDQEQVTMVKRVWTGALLGLVWAWGCGGGGPASTSPSTGSGAGGEDGSVNSAGGAMGTGGATGVGGDAVGGSVPSCELTTCGETCVDTDTSLEHCGGCDTPCKPGENEDVACEAGACVKSCSEGFGECGTGFCGIDLQTDDDHCGACDTPCAPEANEAAACSEGACERTCNEGYGDCTADAGCETDITNTVAHCGACGDACPAQPHADLGCDAGECTFTCQDGYYDCDMSPGCESTLGNDDHCLACGDSCDSSEQCSATGCVPKHRNVFITSSTHNGNLGGLAGADAICQNLADAAGLPGTYMAWLSTADASPSSRFTRHTVPYLLPDGSKVADNYTDLTDGSLDHSISIDENGDVTTNPAGSLGLASCVPSFAFSNTLQNGTALVGGSAYSCSGFTASSGAAAFGEPFATGTRWSNGCGGSGCALQSRFYCFQQ